MKKFKINNKTYKLEEGKFYKLTKYTYKELTEDEFLHTLYTEDNDYIGQGYERVDNSVFGLQIFNNGYVGYDDDERCDLFGTLVYVNTLAQNYINKRETLCDVKVLDELITERMYLAGYICG